MNHEPEPTDDQLDRRLREAYLQTAVQAKFIERTQFAVDAERQKPFVTVPSKAVQTSPTALLSRLLIGFSSLAAVWLLVIYLDTPNDSEGIETTATIVELPQSRQSYPSKNIIANTEVNPSAKSIDNSYALAVSGRNGNLAGKIYDDPEVEVYIVLTTQTTNNQVE